MNSIFAPATSDGLSACIGIPLTRIIRMGGAYNNVADAVISSRSQACLLMTGVDARMPPRRSTNESCLSMMDVMLLTLQAMAGLLERTLKINGLMWM